ncbi:hypothetical protein PRZ48_000251 [Zasmidium cellare]|uniref:Ubiquitin-like protease family profile domain-containing protein n=1 Tax=Zasmidium cellare TaxID=395010 RepID=A0ABR0EYR3_ZASCE|nr:hypothetical protein PRZ48_000251 [Zasmidium cellare]
MADPGEMESSSSTAKDPSTDPLAHHPEEEPPAHEPEEQTDSYKTTSPASNSQDASFAASDRPSAQSEDVSSDRLEPTNARQLAKLNKELDKDKVNMDDPYSKEVHASLLRTPAEQAAYERARAATAAAATAPRAARAAGEQAQIQAPPPNAMPPPPIPNRARNQSRRPNPHPSSSQSRPASQSRAESRSSQQPRQPQRSHDSHTASPATPAPAQQASDASTSTLAGEPQNRQESEVESTRFFDNGEELQAFSPATVTGSDPAGQQQPATVHTYEQADDFAAVMQSQRSIFSHDMYSLPQQSSSPLMTFADRHPTPQAEGPGPRGSSPVHEEVMDNWRIAGDEDAESIARDEHAESIGSHITVDHPTRVQSRGRRRTRFTGRTEVPDSNDTAESMPLPTAHAELPDSQRPIDVDQLTQEQRNILLISSSNTVDHSQSDTGHGTESTGEASYDPGEDEDDEDRVEIPFNPFEVPPERIDAFSDFLTEDDVDDLVYPTTLDSQETRILNPSGRDRKEQAARLQEEKKKGPSSFMKFLYQEEIGANTLKYVPVEFVLHTAYIVYNTFDEDIVDHLIDGTLPRLYEDEGSNEAHTQQLLYTQAQEHGTPGYYMHAIMDAETKEPPSWSHTRAALDLFIQYLDNRHHEKANEIDTKFPSDDPPRMAKSRKGFRRYLFNKDGERVLRRYRACGTFARNLNRILEAVPKDQRATFILEEFFVEIGFSIRIIIRLGEHRGHDGSNYIMNLFQACLELVAPGIYVNKQYVLALCGNTLHAALGEIMASRLAQAYLTSGYGFGHYPAGRSVHGYRSVSKWGYDWEFIEENTCFLGNISRSLDRDGGVTTIPAPLTLYLNSNEPTHRLRIALVKAVHHWEGNDSFMKDDIEEYEGPKGDENRVTHPVPVTFRTFLPRGTLPQPLTDLRGFVDSLGTQHPQDPTADDSRSLSQVTPGLQDPTADPHQTPSGHATAEDAQDLSPTATDLHDPATYHDPTTYPAHTTSGIPDSSQTTTGHQHPSAGDAHDLSQIGIGGQPQQPLDYVDEAFMHGSDEEEDFNDGSPDEEGEDDPSPDEGGEEPDPYAGMTEEEIKKAKEDAAEQVLRDAGMTEEEIKEAREAAAEQRPKDEAAEANWRRQLPTIDLLYQKMEEIIEERMIPLFRGQHTIPLRSNHGQELQEMSKEQLRSMLYRVDHSAGLNPVVETAWYQMEHCHNLVSAEDDEHDPSCQFISPQDCHWWLGSDDPAIHVDHMQMAARFVNDYGWNPQSPEAQAAIVAGSPWWILNRTIERVLKNPSENYWSDVEQLAEKLQQVPSIPSDCRRLVVTFQVNSHIVTGSVHLENGIVTQYSSMPDQNMSDFGELTLRALLELFALKPGNEHLRNREWEFNNHPQRTIQDESYSCGIIAVEAANRLMRDLLPTIQSDMANMKTYCAQWKLKHVRILGKAAENAERARQLSEEGEGE